MPFRRINMILTPFIYPLPDPVLTDSSAYEIPGNTLMAYSKGNPFLDTFYIPSRLIPTAIAGHTFSFQSQHDTNVGLYPAVLLANSIYITTNALYGFQDVTQSIIAMIVTPSTVTVAYKDITTGAIVTLFDLPLTERVSITEDTAAIVNPKMAVKKQLLRRQTLAVNNLPFNITSHGLELGLVPTIVYYPPEGTSYSYLTFRLKNPTADVLTFLLVFSGLRPDRPMWFQVPAGETFELKNMVAVYTDVITMTVLTDVPVHLYVGALHMEGRV
jgi:hypothetical protein